MVSEPVENPSGSAGQLSGPAEKAVGLAAGPGGHRERPIGRFLWDVVTAMSKEFDEELARVGGSRPVWFVLLALCTSPASSQREVAERVGVQDATLTHHLSALEQAGYVKRYRAPEDRRVHRIELTPAGEELFDRLSQAAASFDERLRRGVSDAELATVRSVLTRMLANVTGEAEYPD